MKKRLDVLLVERGLAESRTQAQALVMAGLVPGYDKPGQQVEDDAELELKGRARYVSRGGEKLAHALDAFAIDVTGLDCLDVGASTGGFTDVLLQRGASSVIAIDVGHGQLDWKLRNDPRVVVIRPRHRLPFSFTERRWDVLDDLARIGYLRTREILLGEEHIETHVRAQGDAPSARARRILRAIIPRSL